VKKILFIIGTRPEAIKMAPLIKEFQRNKNIFKIRICLTGQHLEMLQQVITFFKIKPDYNLKIMKPKQTLIEVASKTLKELQPVLDKYKPDLVFVQGDTSTVLVGALAAYYQKSKIAHLEAGLRSKNKYSPFPEEGHRLLVSPLADYHFSPTEGALKNLKKEGITSKSWVVGNTGIDALFLGLKIIKEQKLESRIIKDLSAEITDFQNMVKEFKTKKKRLILVTGHRRENFGQPFQNICKALLEIAKMNKEIEIVYPLHLNPQVKKAAEKILKNKERIHLLKPLSYPQMIWLEKLSYFIITDSGGVQEEAPSLGKPILVTREVTEREEGIKLGTAKLVGTDFKKIVKEANHLLRDKKFYQEKAQKENPYGTGQASKKIVNILKKEKKNSE